MRSCTLVVILLVSSLINSIKGFYIFNETHSKVIKPFRDDKGNVTDAQIAKIKQAINNAQNNYEATEYAKLAKYVFQQMRSSDYQRWNTYVYNGKIKQAGVSSYKLLQKKYIWLTYGKYNLTYLLFSIWICTTEVTGGSTTPAQFGQKITPASQEKILQLVNDSITYRGDDIQGSADYIAPKMQKILSSDYWNVVIASPNTSFGFYICRGNEKWVSLRGYGDFKWNYYFSAY